MEIDWKKKYEEALERARIILCNLGYGDKSISDIETVFPELAESEGEKIREEIVSFIRAFWADHRDSVPQASKWLDWFEKQKDSPMPEDTVVFQKGVEEGRRLEREDMEKERLPIIETYQRSLYTEGYYDGKLKKEPRWIIKTQGICTKFEENPKYGQSLEEEQKPLPGFDNLTPDEKMNHPLYLEGFDAGREVGRVEADQKPDWSEEDEAIYDSIIREIVDKDMAMTNLQKHWLRSLKNRGNFSKSNTNSPWKPSDEQMGLFGRIVNDLKIKMVGVTIKEHHTLESLYNDLTKLL